MARGKGIYKRGTAWWIRFAGGREDPIRVQRIKKLPRCRSQTDAEEEGCPGTVGNLPGHKDIKMTLRYSRLSPSHKAASIGVLDLALQTPANCTKTIQSATSALPGNP